MYTEVRALVDKLTDALSARDAHRVAECYADENFMFTLAPPLEVTPEESPGIEGVKKWLASFEGPLEYETKDFQFSASGDVAFCHMLRNMRGQKGNGEYVDLWYRETFGLKKLGDEWRIAHQHQSVPFYMDGTFRAAVDLTP